MILDWAVIAQYAAPQADGSIAILGAGTENFASFDRESLPPELQARLDPALVGTEVSFHLVARFRIPRHELQRGHSIEADVIDSDGNSVMPRLAFNVPPMAPPPGLTGPELGVVAHFQLRVAPKKFGPYSIALFCDTASVKTTSFQIVAQQAPQQPPPPPTST